MKPRALVVRSGAAPFPDPQQPLRIEIVEKRSHRIAPVAPPEEELARPARLAIFTSQIAARRVLEEPALREGFERALSDGRVAAVGAATAAALRRGGIEPAIVAAGSGESVLDRLPGDLQGWDVLLPRGEDSAEELPAELARRGARVTRLVLYRKVPEPADPALSREILERPFDAFCATSPSAARWLFTVLGEEEAARLRGIPAVALGRSTGRFLAASGVARVEIAPEATFRAAARLLESLAAGDSGE